MEEMTIWEQHTITLTRDPKIGFGFALSGGRDKPNPDTGDTAVVVSDVVRNGPAMGRIYTRDQIVMVNGISMENVTSNFTIQNLKGSGKTANITIKRPRKIQIPMSNRPTRAASSSNLLEDKPRMARRPSDSDSDRSHDRYRRRARSSTPDRNGHALPLMSGFKRLPEQTAADKPIRATLLKKKLTDEYGLKLGSQIFIKHMTSTGLAAKEGTLQEGDLILKINGMTTENLSLLETKHLVEKSKGKLSMLVLRDDRKFLVSIPEVEDSAPNSEEDRNGDSSSELEDISDLDIDIPFPNKDRVSRSTRRTRRTRGEALPTSKSQNTPPLRSTMTRTAQALPAPRRAPSESDSDRSPTPPSTRRNASDMRDPSDKYRTLSGVPSLPNPRASPVARASVAPRVSSAASRPRKAVSESDSDQSASPPSRRDPPKTDNRSKYRVLPEGPHPGLRPMAVSQRQETSRGSSPYRPPPPDDSESESDEERMPPRRQGTPNSQDSRNRYRGTPEVPHSPMAEPPRWNPPTMTKPVPRIAPSRSESDASYASAPSSPEITANRDRYRDLSEMNSAPVSVRRESSRRAPSPTRPPPEDSSESDRAPSPPRRNDSTDEDNNPRSLTRPVNGTVLSGISMARNPTLNSKAPEEPLYYLPPDSLTTNVGYSSDLNKVTFVKDGNVGLRLVGGNDIGIFVGGVQPNSPAQLQGMKEGDQIMQVNGVDFGHFTREEAAMFLLNIRKGENVDIRTQSKMDIYRKILKSNVGDSFYIRTHFDHDAAEDKTGLSFTRGEVFRVVDTMHRGKLGTWQAVRMGNDLHELDKGTIPNQSRAETLANMEKAQRASGVERQVSGPRAEFWKLRGLRGAKKSARQSRDDLLQLTIQGKFPAYEKVLLREANFKRPIVILGPLNDIAMEKLSREMPDEFEIAEMVPRAGGESASTVIKLDTVRRIAEKDKHPLLDITPTAVERLNYIQYHPMVLFLDPRSRKDVKTMRQQLSPNSSKSSRRLYTQALKLKKHWAHLFAARIDLQPGSGRWYESLKDKIRQQQAKPVWVSEVTLEAGGEGELDTLDRSNSNDYLSCDSRGASDYEDTDGDANTDNEDLEEFNQPDRTPSLSKPGGVALARSSEPASEREGSASEPELSAPDHSPREIPPLLQVPEPWSTRNRSYSHSLEVETPSPPTHSFSDSDFSVTDPPTAAMDEPPDFRAPDPTPQVSAEPPRFTPPAEIEEKLPQTQMAQPQEKKTPQFIVLAHHQAVQIRRTQINGSDSSDNDESEDVEWGPATEL